MKLCFVTNFTISMSQWHDALLKMKQYLIDEGIEYSEINITPSRYSMRVNYHDKSCLQCIIDADVIFMYCSSNSRNGIWKDHEAPYYVRQLNPKAKLVVWWDNDKLQPEAYYKKYPKDSVDHAIYITKNYDYPVSSTQMLMPQMCHYSNHLNVAPEPKRNGKVAVMVHSTKDCSVNQLINNINADYLIFNSRVGRLNREEYFSKLRKCWIAVDDSDNYYGWSRFVMECVLAHVPCIGCTPAVKLFYPDLYIEPHDFKRTVELMNKLVDVEYYNKQTTQAYPKLQLLTAEHLVPILIHLLKHQL